jgi:hypothetical protein
MRDPQARVIIQENDVIRHLREALLPEHPLLSSQAKQWVESGLLISFEFTEPCLLKSPRVPFVSSPEEWCDAQLFDAAKLTLSLLESANEFKADLKDASAWNVIFNGCTPVFCDLTSLEPLSTHAWWAAGQFVRHFISPLWLARETSLKTHDIFRMFRDGASPEIVRGVLGWRRFFSRCWPLIAHPIDASVKAKLGKQASDKTIKYRQNLITSLRWMLDGVEPPAINSTIWVNYTEERQHYLALTIEKKRQLVAQWLNSLKPRWTLDLGCNTGEFSRIAMDSGSKVIALDGDHDVIQKLYLDQSDSNSIYPILSSLDDIHSGRGWGGAEHIGLVKRLEDCADLVMMLALIHHLSIAAAIPLEEVARFAATCTRRWLVVEWLEPSDPQVLKLCTQRRREADQFSVSRQRQAFVDAGFVLLREASLTPGQRILALLEKRS